MLETEEAATEEREEGGKKKKERFLTQKNDTEKKMSGKASLSQEVVVG